MRGALPNWFAGAARERSLVQIQVVGGTRRDAVGDAARHQDVLASTRFGRGVPPSRNGVPVTFWLTPIGKPVWKVITGVTCQPPKIRSHPPAVELIVTLTERH